MCDQETRRIKVASGHGPIYYLTETFLLTSPCIGLISLDFPVFLWRFCFDLKGTANACCSVPPLDTRTFALLPFLDGVVSSSTFICMMPWYWNDNESNDGESSDLKRWSPTGAAGSYSVNDIRPVVKNGGRSDLDKRYKRITVRRRVLQTQT